MAVQDLSTEALVALRGTVAKRARTVALDSGGHARDHRLDPIVERVRRALVALAAEAAPPVSKYSEDEARGADGRWTSGGGSGKTDWESVYRRDLLPVQVGMGHSTHLGTTTGARMGVGGLTYCGQEWTADQSSGHGDDVYGPDVSCSRCEAAYRAGRAPSARKYSPDEPRDAKGEWTVDGVPVDPDRTHDVPHHVEQWYDRHTKSWVTETRDIHGCQIGNASFDGGRKALAASSLRYHESLMRDGLAPGGEGVGSYATRTAHKYSPDQPRDDHGRFGTTGGSAYTPAGSLDGGRTPVNQSVYWPERSVEWGTAPLMGTHEGKPYLDMIRAYKDGLYTPDEKAAVNAAAARYVADSTVRIRVPTDVLYAIMGGEESRGQPAGVQNQFQSANSGGVLDPDARAAQEGRLFFGKGDPSPEQRPVYGYLGNPGDPPPWVGQYGDAVLVLKDSVSSRTTFTIGDSFQLDNGVPVPLSRAGDLGYLASESKIPFSTSIDRWASNGSWIYGGGDYVETQVFGGVRPSDIDHVVFTKDPPGEGTTYWLDHAGVPWTMAGKDEFTETGPVPVVPGSV